MSQAAGDDKPSSGVAKRLPRGRHGLSREAVAASQRERTMRALIDVMAENGYTATSISDILRQAGVSRESFYEQFRSKEDCFEQCFDWAIATADITARGAVLEGEADDDPCARMDRVFAAYLRDLVDDRARAKVFLIEAFAAGPRFSVMRAERHFGFVGVLIGIFGAQTDGQRFACQMLAATIGSMVTAAVAADDFEELLRLREPLMRMVRGSRELYGTVVPDGS